MNEPPKISIIMPVFNGANFLRESLDSILQQTFEDWELIIIDDDSTDNTLNIIQSFKDSRISINSNTHDFVGSLNKGLSLSRGKYIARMDADDIMLHERLQVQFDFMESHCEIDICGSWAETFGESYSIIQAPLDNTQIGSLMLLYNPIVHPSVMMKRSIFLDDSTTRYSSDYPCAEDYKLWTDLFLKGFRFYNIQKVLLRYRHSKDQVTNRRYLDVNDSSLRVRVEYAERLIELMCIREMKFKPFFESLIDLTNYEIIELNSLLITIHYIYNDYFYGKE